MPAVCLSQHFVTVCMLLRWLWVRVVVGLVGRSRVTAHETQVSGIVTLLTPLLAWLFIFRMDLGFIGCPIAMAVASLLIFFGLIGVTVMVPSLHRECWGGFSLEALKGWGTFFKLGIPGLVMLCAEWWAFEVLAAIAGWLGEIPLATHSIVFNILSFLFM